jgi:glycolate oxidase FAD binding subunit
MLLPDKILTPADAQELAQIVQAAMNARTPLQVIGGGSKQSIGFPGRETALVSTEKLDQIIDYDPSELVLTVQAGTRLSVIQELLASHGQMLAFEPFDFALASGATPGSSTIGGVVAAGFAGSRRLSAGNVRDHLLGFTAVSGRGEQFVAGGRVVKNVTGYDLSKLMCGSWGQLAILTQLTLKVLPRPRMSLTLSVSDLDDAVAFATMTRAVRSRCELAAAAYLPQGLIDRRSHTLLRLEGFGPSIDARAAGLEQVLSELAVDRLMGEAGSAAWSSIPAAMCCDGAATATVLWRLCIPSTSGARLCAALRDLGGDYCVDWGGALIWARLPASATAEKVRAAAAAAGGHATMMCAPIEYRTRASAQHPESAGVAALAARVKLAFDPAGILDPHRFAA